MLDSAILNQLIFDAFTGKMTWLHASTLHPLDDFIEAFYRTRASMQQRVLEGLTDGQAAFFSEKVATWSISETITHLVYSQNFYYNALLDITSSQLPHILEAARGFGEGAKHSVPADTLREMLQKATVLIRDAIEQTRHTYDVKRIVRNPLFGDTNYPTWVLLMLGHEVDHIRQSLAMRQLARRVMSDTLTDSTPTPPAPPAWRFPSVG
jgi:hypothetical protein